MSVRFNMSPYNRVDQVYRGMSYNNGGNNVSLGQLRKKKTQQQQPDNIENFPNNIELPYILPDEIQNKKESFFTPQYNKMPQANNKQQHGVTSIDDLEEFTEGYNNRGEGLLQPSSRRDKAVSFRSSNETAQPPDNLHKYIRNTNSRPPPESGMTRLPPSSHQDQSSYFEDPSNMDNMFMTPPRAPVISSFGEDVRLPNPMLYDTPSCLEISNHIQLCPICSKIYNTDKTLYIISNIILIVLCLLLLKRVLKI